MRYDTQKLIDLIDGSGMTWRSYSGRGMYGDRCVGITTGNVFETIADLIDSATDDDDYDLLSDMVRNASTDSMGMDQIIYFPRFKLTDDMEHESDED